MGVQSQSLLRVVSVWWRVEAGYWACGGSGRAQVEPLRDGVGVQPMAEVMLLLLPPRAPFRGVAVVELGPRVSEREIGVQVPWTVARSLSLSPYSSSRPRISSHISLPYSTFLYHHIRGSAEG